MNSQHRTIRALLQSMAPKRAISYIKAFGLPPEEELFVVECDVRGKSYIQAAQEHNVSPETIKRRRKSAYTKIADELNCAKEEDRGI